MHSQRAMQHATLALCPVRWPQGLKRKNFKLKGSNLNFFFLHGVNRNSPKLHEVKTY